MNKIGTEGINPIYKNYSTNKNKKNNVNEKSQTKNTAVDIKKDNIANKDYTYTKLSEKNIKNVDILKSEMDKSYSNLKKLINDLILKQNSEEKKIKLNGEIAKKAKEATSKNGRFSPEKLSDKIVDFAKNISGGNKSKFNELKNAIIQGFEEAKKVLGGELPEISKKTYTLVMEKLEDWKSE